MDEIVKAALKKWPNVPACYGWLALDARGDWYMRDDRIQAAGPFPYVKGSRIDHQKLKEFIQRNYLCDAEGSWFFQNGPQRVYVQLEAAPWIMGVHRDGDGHWQVDTHTGAIVDKVNETWVDQEGRLFLATNLGLGLMRSADMDVAADAVASGVWSPQPVDFSELPGRYRYQLMPQAATI